MKPERLAITIVEAIKDGYPRFDQDSKIWRKLRSLEDIEQELGIDLVTLFKAINNGIYCIGGFTNKIEFIENPNIGRMMVWDFSEKRSYSELCVFEIDDDYDGEYNLVNTCRISDYGKTWALTKEELEQNQENKNGF